MRSENGTSAMRRRHVYWNQNQWRQKPGGIAVYTQIFEWKDRAFLYMGVSIEPIKFFRREMGRRFNRPRVWTPWTFDPSKFSVTYGEPEVYNIRQGEPA